MNPIDPLKSHPASSPVSGSEEVFNAVAVPEPRQVSSAATVLSIIRMVLVGLACLGVTAMAVTFWQTTAELASNATGLSFAQTRQQEQAKAELAQVELQLAQEREQLRRKQEFAQQWPQQFTAAGSPGTASPLLVELERLLATSSVVEPYHVQNLSRLNPNNEEIIPARDRLRAAMQSEQAPVGRICRLVLSLQDDVLRQELLASLSSADQVRLRYRLHEADGLIELLEQISPEEQERLLPVVVELVRRFGEPARQKLGSYLDANPDRAVALAPLAHHRDSFVCEFVRPRLPADALWPAALEALTSEYGSALSAVSWIAVQEVVPERREQVIALLLSRLWITDGKEYPALAALGRWGDERSADAVAEIGHAPSAEPVAAEVCRILARWSPEKLQEVVSHHLANVDWNRAAVQAMREEPAVARAVAAALREAAPHDAHEPYIEALFYTATADDVPWLRAYQIRLRSTDLSRGRSMGDRLEQIIRRKSAGP